MVKNKKVDSLVVLSNKQRDAPSLEKRGKLVIDRCWRSNGITTPVRVLTKILKYDPDLIHFNLHLMNWGKGRLVNFLGGLIPGLAKYFGYPVVVKLHNIAEAVDLDKIEGIASSRVNHLGLWLVTKRLLSVDTVSVTIKRYMSILEKRYRANNVVYMPHGAFGVQVSEVATGGRTILMFGHLSGHKDLPLLIEAFREMHAEDEQLRLVVAGGSHPNFPNYLEILKRRYGYLPNIVFTDYIPGGELKELFTSSTVVVLPYLTSTGSSGVFHLACSFARPVIMSDLPDFRAMLEDEDGSAILVPINDKEALKEAVRRVIGDETLQRSLGERNLCLAARSNFNHISHEYVDLYEDILGAKNG